VSGTRKSGRIVSVHGVDSVQSRSFLTFATVNDQGGSVPFMDKIVGGESLIGSPVLPWWQSPILPVAPG
jgi:hypothetical protein